ncbi:MAG: DUF84 family protein [Candidatus Brennerbacteria bacterium]|nr:DUF84 family protein [Candidatus Brennerbacteria bacterium]
MKVNVGSKNITKVQAVEEALSDFPEFSSAEVIAMAVDSGVHKQPKSMEQTVQGAMNRAKNAFKDCDLSFGFREWAYRSSKHKKWIYEYYYVCHL